MNTLNITPFVPRSSAQDAYLALKQAVKSMDQARHCAVLWFREIVSRKLFRDLGCFSAYQYATTELDFSSTRCGDFLMVDRKLDELPQLRSAMEEGGIGYTKAREVIKVACSQSEGLWIETAKQQSRQELRRRVHDRGWAPGVADAGVELYRWAARGAGCITGTFATAVRV